MSSNLILIVSSALSPLARMHLASLQRTKALEAPSGAKLV